MAKAIQVNQTEKWINLIQIEILNSVGLQVLSEHTKVNQKVHLVR